MPDSPFILYCARHDPARVLELERLSYDVLTRLRAVYGDLDSQVSTYFPRFTKANASDAMQDLLEEFLPKYRKLIGASSDRPTGAPLRSE